MKIKIFILCSLFFVLSLSGCEKQIDIDETPHQLVLNGIPSAGERAFVYFANTRFFLSNDNNNPVAGASVTLYVDGVSYSPDSIVNCKYFFPYTYAEGDSLRIDVTASGHNVHARTYVPDFPDISDYTNFSLSGPTFNFYVAEFNLNDHAGVDEIYNISVQVRDSGARYNDWTKKLDTIDTIHTTYFFMPDRPEITGNDVCPYIPLGGYLYSRVMFLDKNIDGQQYKVPINILHLIDTNEQPGFRHEYFVKVESITPARFRYILSASSQSSMISFFAEQGEAYSNVDGALGIFAGVARRKYAFDPDTLSHISSSTKGMMIPEGLDKLYRKIEHR